MTIAVLFGASSGALHAVTGPDHVLSLGPLVFGSGRAPWRIGLRWGLGHALGTLLLALPVLWLMQLAHLPLLASWGERLAGMALLATAAWSFPRGRLPAAAPARAERNALWVGVLHGLTGAASLLLLVPMLASTSRLTCVAFLLAFALGSTLAMAALTAALAKVGSRMDERLVLRSRHLSCAASAGLGLFWLVFR